jgi:addiction module HigA family antidote
MMSGTEDLGAARRPTLPGEVLRHDYLEPNDITQDVFADAIGMSRYSVNQLVNGRRSVTAETALRIAKATGTEPEYWLNLQRGVDLYEARREIAQELERVRLVAPPLSEEAELEELAPDTGNSFRPGRYTNAPLHCARNLQRKRRGDGRGGIALAVDAG